jgi:outer membrane protein assembly factor BamB
MRARRTTLIVFGISLCASTAGALDWPQWRGPQRDGISQETGLLKEWPKDGPKLLWQLKDIGDGYSTPAVVGDRLFVINNKGMEDEFVQAIATEDGKPVWSKRIGKVGPNSGPQYPASRSTPTVDGDVLYALGSDGDLACLDTASGDIRWHKNLRSDFAGKPGRWAYAESPLVDGDVLVCTPGGTKATLAALNKKTGDVIWKSPVPGGDQAGYASIVADEVGGVKQYIQFLQHGVVGVDAKTGAFLWRYDKTGDSPANIPTPVLHADLVFTENPKASGLIKLSVAQGSVTPHEIYLKPNLPAAIGGSVLVDDSLYGTNKAGLICVELATGDIKWKNRSVGAGAVCFADGRLYLHGENNDVALVEATPQGYVEKGRFTPSNPPSRRKGRAWAYPVVANGRLYIRDAGSLWCYDVRGQVAAK